MEKTKTKSERGMEEYKLWRGSNLRGHRMIGQYIINRYELTEEDLKRLFKSSVDKLNIENAKRDVIPIIKDSAELDVWSKEFFSQLYEIIKVV